MGLSGHLVQLSPWHLCQALLLRQMGIRTIQTGQPISRSTLTPGKGRLRRNWKPLAPCCSISLLAVRVLCEWQKWYE